MGAKFGFRGKNVMTGRGKVPVGPAVLQGSLGLGELWPPPAALRASHGGFIGVYLAELPPPPPSKKAALPNLLGLLSFPSI